MKEKVHDEGEIDERSFGMQLQLQSIMQNVGEITCSERI